MKPNKKLSILTIITLLFLFPSLGQALTYQELYNYSQGKVLSATVVDINAFGACSKGSSDASSEVQSSINALTDGGTLQVSCVPSLLNGVVLANKKNITVVGINGGGFKVLGIPNQSIIAFSGVMFKIDNCTDCLIKDLELNGNSIQASSIGIQNSTRTTVSNIKILNTGFGSTASNRGSAALVASGNKNNTYSGIVIDSGASPSQYNGEGARGMWLGNWWKEALEWHPTVTGNTVKRTPFTGIGLHSVGAQISNNTVENVGCAGVKVVVGRQSQDSSNYSAYNSSPAYTDTTNITNNTLRNNGCNGVQMDYPSNVNIDKNILDNNDHTGIFVYASVNNLNITNNSILNNKSGNFIGGIHIESGPTQAIKISGNIIGNQGTQNQKFGISVSSFANSFGGAISGLEVTCNKIVNNHSYGNVFWNNNGSSYSNISYTNNAFAGNAGQDIFVQSGANFVTQSGNTTTGNLPSVCSSGGSNPPPSPPPPPPAPNPPPPAPTPPPSPSPTSTPSTGFVTINSKGVLRNDYTGWVGFSFTVGQKDIKVSKLGRFIVSGNNQIHVLKIIKATDKSTVAQVSLNTQSQTAGQFAYQALDNPAILNANHTYYIVSQETDGGDKWYDFDNTLLSGNALALVNNAVYWTGSSYATTGIVGSSYGPLDFKIALETGNNNPNPTPPPPPPPAPTPETITGKGFVKTFNLGSKFNQHGGWVGMRIKVGNSPIYLTALGRMVLAGNTESHKIKIVESKNPEVQREDNEALGQVVVATKEKPENQFVYSALATPVKLEANKTYYLVSEETYGGDFYYSSIWDNKKTTLTTENVASVLGGVYWWTGTKLWTYQALANEGDGPLDFKYTLESSSGSGNLTMSPNTNNQKPPEQNQTNNNNNSQANNNLEEIIENEEILPNSFASGSLVLDGQIVYYIYGQSKIAFASMAVIRGYGYKESSIVKGDASNYILDSYVFTTSKAGHPWGSWLVSGKQVYYFGEVGFIPVSTWEIFVNNGGQVQKILKMNSYDLASLKAVGTLPIMEMNDSRVVK